MSFRSTVRFGLTVLSFWPFLPIASRAPLYGRLFLELVRDGRVPWSRKVLLGLAAAYVASPIDLVPDFVPFISRVDDVAVVVQPEPRWLRRPDPRQQGLGRHIVVHQRAAVAARLVRQ